MKPIFRAWKISQGRWTKWGEIEMGYDNHEKFNRFYPWWNDTRVGYHIMQFTGLKDKNGKDVYEGDILHDLKFTEQTFEVKWDDDGAGFVLYCITPENCKGHSEDCNDLILKSMEIVGNIYEKQTD